MHPRKELRKLLKTTSCFALSPQGVLLRPKKQRPDPNGDFRAESHYARGFFITCYYPFKIVGFWSYFFRDRNHIGIPRDLENLYHHAVPLN